MRIAIHTLGTRGDVQPYVALALGLKAAGHDVVIAAPDQFADFVRGYNIPFAALPGEFLDLLERPEIKDVINKGSGFGSGLKLLKRVKPMMLRLFDAEWFTAREFQPDLILYHPKALVAPHIAEKLGAASILASPLPGFTPTAAFPTPLLPFASLGPFNRWSHWLMIKSPELLFGKIIKSWRQKELGLPASTQKRPAAPVIYAYSPAVAPVPSDWGRNVCVSGYWFLGEPSTWAPPASLAAFLHAGPPPVYVGFGSMPIADAGDMATMFINALERTGRRGVIAAGWGGLGASTKSQNIHFIESAPHDRLFPLMDAVVHHGGAGTTAAGLRAGKPTVICPFFGDQPFWARRVQALGAGPPPLVRRKLTVDSIAAAIIGATSTENIRANAETVGRKIRSENGVGVAVDFIARRVASELDEVVLRRRH